MAIEYKKLGPISAEKDTGLSSYFYDSTEFYRASFSFDDKRFILLGRTGSGKSAIIQFLNAYFEDDNDVIVSLVCDETSNLAEFSRKVREAIEYGDDLVRLVFKTAWYYTIVLQILKKRFPDGPLKTLSSDRNMEVYKFLSETNNFYGEKSLGDLFSGVVDKITMKLAALGVEASFGLKTKTTHDFLKIVERFVKHELANVIGNQRKLYVLIDDIDHSWDYSNDNQQEMLAALYSVLTEFSRRDNTKALMALRTNILMESTKLHQREKVLDEIISIKWNQQMLRDFIELRVRTVYGLDQSDLYGNFFVNKEIIAKMIRYTLLRPRDLLSLCDKTIKQSSLVEKELVDHNDLRHVLEDYSLERMVALKDEWQDRYPNLQVLAEEFAKLLSKEDLEDGLTTRGTQHAMKLLAKEIRLDPKLQSQVGWFLDYYGGEKANPRDILKVLYSVGFIVIKDPDGSFHVHTDPSTESPPKITKGCLIMVHPTFVPYLETLVVSPEDEAELWG